MDLFRIDPEMIDLINSLNDKDLVSFAELHEEPGDDAHIELSIYCLYVVYQRTGSNDHFERAILRSEGWTAATPADFPDLKRRLEILDAMTARRNFLSRLYGAVQEESDIVTPTDYPDQLAWLNNLGVRLSERYLRTGAVADLEETIRIAQEIVNATPAAHPDRATFLNNLGVRLGDRYSKTGAMADLEESIRITQEAVSMMSAYHPTRAVSLNMLGVRLGQRYSRTEVIADLEEAIRIIEEAITTTPAGHPHRAGFLSNLGNELSQRYSRTAAMADLEEAIKITQEAVNISPANHPGRATLLNNLGNRLNERYTRLGLMADLEAAIQVAQEAVNSISADHPDRPACLNNLGNRLNELYTRLGLMADLEAAIQVAQEAVNSISADHEDRPACLDNLGVRISERYSRTGAMDDLERAIRIAQKAVNTTTRHHPGRGKFLNNLGIHFNQRYLRTGAMADLDEAIRITQEAVHTAPADHIDRRRLYNLAIRFGERYSRTGAMADLEEAIRVARQTVDATPVDHPDRAFFLNNLATRFRERYSRTGATADLERAIQISKQAVNTTPADHPSRAAFLNNLGIHFNERYLRTRAMADLEEAIQNTQEAVNAIPADHPERAGFLASLGNQLGKRYFKTAATPDIEHANSCFFTALHQNSSSLFTRIQAGREMIKYCAIIQDWQQAYEASHIAVGLIPKLALRSLENSDKQHILSRIVGLASEAAAVALQADKGPLVALDLLEQGRGVLAASLEEIRADTLGLQERYPGLAKQFVHLRDELELPVTRSTSFVNEDHEPSWRTQASRRYEAGKELDELIVEIRNRPGFEDFLGAPSVADMRSAAQCGPLVVVNVSEQRCDAILVEQHQIRSLRLPDLNIIQVKEKAQRCNLGSSEVLEWLWNTFANPILAALGFAQPPSEDNWPHVWWIPTGPLSKFPLHAAGRHGEGSSETVLDRVMSSYSLSIKTTIHGRRRRVMQSPSSQALLVAMQHTPGNFKGLPFAGKEVAMLRGLCKSMAFSPIEPPRYKIDITSRLPQCQIFHFAGHGHTDDTDPSRSHLLLADGKSNPLTVANLLEMNLREHSPFLAYLSACGTGQVRDERFVDESIHLISAFQLAGFRHVIGTLWEVSDEICVDIARITYQGMRDGRMKDEAVCRGLHNATRELRDRWLNMSTLAGHGSRSVRKIDVTLVEHGVSARNVSDRAKTDDRLPRDVVLTENDDGIGLWVPFVHFGV